MNWASDVAQILLNTYKHHHTETRLIFTIFVSMSRPRSLFMWYLCDLFLFLSSFSLWLIVKSNEYRQTCSFAYFLEYVLDDNADEECD